MIRYSFLSVRNHFRHSLLFIIALVAIFLAIPLSLSTLMEMNATIEADIREHGRGSYDLLIRPADSQANVEQELNLVEENYVSFNEGGISLDEWEEIKTIEGIDIAAPVASLGYFTGQHTSIEFANQANENVMVNGYFSMSDGINQYQFANNEDPTFILEQEGFNFNKSNDTLTSFDVIPGTANIRKAFPIPISYYSLVAIDREQEEKLTGFDLSAFNNEIDETLLVGHTEEYLGGDSTKEPVDHFIPIVYLETADTSLTFHMTVDPINWSSDDTLALKDAYGINEEDPFFMSGPEVEDQMIEELHARRTGEQQLEIDLSEYLKPFYHQQPTLTSDGRNVEKLGGYETITHSSQYYVASPVDYEIRGEQITIGIHDEIDGVPTYRKLEEKGKVYEFFDDESSEFLFAPVGSYTVGNYEESLAASPLGIYQQSPVTAGDGTVITETIKPGSFVASPAQGLVQLKEAAYFKGDKPIDAIRVKVAGITEYDEEAQSKIEEIILAIQNRGTYQIDMVAGSSPQLMTMNVEGIGEVTQYWTGLGAATTISEGWSLTNTIIAGLFFLASISYVINRFMFRRRTRQSEQRLLTDLGWKPAHIRRFYLLESLMLTLIALLISVIGTFVFIQTGLLNWNAYVYLLAVFGFTVLIMFIQSFGNSEPSIFTFSTLKGKKIWVRNVLFYRQLISVTFFQLAMIAAVMVFVASSLIATVAATSATNLGTYIVDGVFLSLVLIVIAAFALAMITVTESVSAFLLLRKGELQTLRDVGWRPKDVYHLCLKESSAWTLVAIASGVLASSLAVFILFEFSFMLLLATLGGAIVLALGVLIAAHQMIQSHIKAYS